MNESFLKRKSKNPIKASKDRADTALQESYRRNFPNEKCEACGKKFNLMHHHIEKCNSMFARWMQPDNLIFLCKECHQNIHFGNADPISAYSIKRGDAWKKKIMEMRKQKPPTRLKKIDGKMYVYYMNINVEDYYNNEIPKKFNESVL